MEKRIKKYKPYVDVVYGHPYAVPLTVFFILFFLSISILIGLNATTVGPDDSHIIQLSINNQEEFLPSRAKTVGEFLERAEIEVGSHDRVEPSVDSQILGKEFKINVYRARPVTVVDEDGTRTRANSSATTPRSVANQVGVKVYPEDRLISELPEKFIKEGVIGEKIVINRATPVSLNLYGTGETTRTHAQTVEQLLEEKEVVLGAKDKVRPSLATRLKSNQQIFVTREGIQIKTIEEEIPMPVEIIEDSSLSFGAQAIRQEGSPGKKTVTYEIKLKNGKEISRRVIQSAIITQPVKQIMAQGPQGDFGEALSLLRSCESGGNYAINTGNGYYGAYQYDISTWNGYGGYRLASDAPPAIQDQKARETYVARGWQPWPSCSSNLGLQDIYR